MSWPTETLDPDVKQALEPLIPALLGPDCQNRRAALVCARHPTLDPARDWLVERLLKALEGPDGGARAKAASALAEIGAVKTLTRKLLHTRGAPRQVRLIDVLRRMVPHLSVCERLHLQGDLDLVAFRANSLDVSVAVGKVHEAVIAADRASPSTEWR